MGKRVRIDWVDWTDLVRFLVVTGKVHYPGTFLYLGNRHYQVWEMVYLGLDMGFLEQNKMYKKIVIADHTLAWQMVSL